MEQMSIFDYLERNGDKTEQNGVKTERNEETYVKELVRCLKIWDKTWNYGYFDKIKESNNAEDIIEEIYIGTTGHYFKIDGDMYSSDGKDVYEARLDKDEKVLRFYKVCKTPEKILAEVSTEELAKELVKA